MNKILSIVFVLLFQVVNGQTQDKWDDIYISELTNNSVLKTEIYPAEIRSDIAAMRLIESKDPLLNKKLLSYIDDKAKTLAIHIILTKRIDNGDSKFCLSFVYADKKLTQVNYIYNNLNWYWTSKYNKCEISQSEMSKLKLYWTGKIH